VIKHGFFWSLSCPMVQLRTCCPRDTGISLPQRHSSCQPASSLHFLLCLWFSCLPQ
jgi:hypothetical protein